MTTQATILASVNGGAVATGHIVATLGQTVQLSRAATDGARTVRYELYAYPPGFACPTGWIDSDGVYVYAGDNPPSFTLSLWGKYLPRLRYNGCSDLDATGLLDSSMGLEVYASTGIRDTARGETDQCGGVVETFQENWRRVDHAISQLTSSKSIANTSGTNTVTASWNRVDTDITGCTSLRLNVDGGRLNFRLPLDGGWAYGTTILVMCSITYGATLVIYGAYGDEETIDVLLANTNDTHPSGLQFCYYLTYTAAGWVGNSISYPGVMVNGTTVPGLQFPESSVSKNGDGEVCVDIPVVKWLTASHTFSAADTNEALGVSAPAGYMFFGGYASWTAGAADTNLFIGDSSLTTTTHALCYTAAEAGAVTGKRALMPAVAIQLSNAISAVEALTPLYARVNSLPATAVNFKLCFVLVG